MFFHIKANEILWKLHLESLGDGRLYYGMSTSEEQLIERLRSIERLFDGATTPGERIAAANAMERVDQKILDQQLGLRAMGYTSSVVVALGYRSASDANASLPKSRRPLEAILTRV